MSCWHPSFSRSSPNCSIIPHRLHLPRSHDDVEDFGTYGNLVRPSGLHCNFCSYSRDFPSNFLFHGSLPPHSCFVPAPRALTLTGQTLSCLANQPYSRLLLCSSGLGFLIIAAPRGLSPQCAYCVGRTQKNTPGSRRRCFRSLVSGHTYLMTSLYEKLAYSQIFFYKLRFDCEVRIASKIQSPN